MFLVLHFVNPVLWRIHPDQIKHILHFCVHTVTHNGIGEVILLALRKASNSSATALTLNVEIVLTSNYSIDEPNETRYSKDPRMILKGNNKRGIFVIFVGFRGEGGTGGCLKW